MARRITAQLSRPSGIVGRQVTLEMAATNAAMICDAIDKLDVQPQHRVVEIGFGSPRSLAELLRRASEGTVAAVDHSPLAVRTAKRRLRAEVAAGRLRVLEATAEDLPLEESTADRILALNTVTYWSDPDVGFRELTRISSPEANVVIGVRTPDVLQRLGISGDTVHYLEETDIEAFATRSRLIVGDAHRASDRRGGYILVRLAPAPS
jgi:SAM-dependent methyltransferase